MDDQEPGQDFILEVRHWLAKNFPPALAGVSGLIFQGNAHAAADSADYQLWRQRMADKGWGVPTWPQRFGGADLTKQQGKVIGEELLAIGGFNPIRSYGTMMLGPTLLEYGTEEQKAEHLPWIARHERRWCQGFSEPGAGSDLASLQTKCIDQGDHWLVSGQKIWTSGADQADWCFALVRTDTSHKQRGISFLLIDMKSPGIEARPIVLISGSTHFCEVFFNDVKVPKGNLVGEVNGGWSVAKRLLQFERGSLSEVKTDMTPLGPLAHRRHRCPGPHCRCRSARAADRQRHAARRLHAHTAPLCRGSQERRSQQRCFRNQELVVGHRPDAGRPVARSAGRERSRLVEPGLCRGGIRSGAGHAAQPGLLDLRRELRSSEQHHGQAVARPAVCLTGGTNER
jgi:hypothetical protein